MDLTKHLRSLITQAVSSDEVGKVYSIYALIGAFGSSLVGSVYMKFYNITLDKLPGAYLIVATAFMLATIPFNLVARKMVETFNVIKDEESTKL